MSIISFLGSPLGIVFISVLSSILGTWLYKLCQHLYSKANSKIKYKRFIKRLTKIGEMYCSGYTAAYAKNKSHFHQALHVNKFTISLLVESLRIVIFAFIALGLLILFQEYFIVRAIIIALASVAITIQCQKVKTIYKTYQFMYDHEFGNEYQKNMMNGMEKYWGELTGNEKNK